MTHKLFSSVKPLAREAFLGAVMIPLFILGALMLWALDRPVPRRVVAWTKKELGRARDFFVSRFDPRVRLDHFTILLGVLGTTIWWLFLNAPVEMTFSGSEFAYVGWSILFEPTIVGAVYSSVVLVLLCAVIGRHYKVNLNLPAVLIVHGMLAGGAWASLYPVGDSIGVITVIGLTISWLYVRFMFMFLTWDHQLSYEDSLRAEYKAKRLDGARMHASVSWVYTALTASVITGYSAPLVFLSCAWIVDPLIGWVDRRRARNKSLPQGA